MPIYEYECPLHGTFEHIQNSYEPKKEMVCEKKSNCGMVAIFQMSLVTMKPDSHWNGTVLPNGKLVTNSKEYRRQTEHWETRSDASDAYTKQRKAEKEKETKKKIEKQVEQYVQSELSGVNL